MTGRVFRTSADGVPPGPARMAFRVVRNQADGVPPAHSGTGTGDR